MTSDKDAAEYYVAHKDEADQWDEPIKVARPQKQRLGAMVSVRFSREEVETIRDAAERAGESVSQFVRNASLRSAQPAASGSVWVSQTGYPSHMSITGRIVAPTWAPGIEGAVTTPEGTQTLAGAR